IACVEAGADGIFPEAITDLPMYERFASAAGVPVPANITEFGATPHYTVEELAGVGAAIVVYPLPAFRGPNNAADDVDRTVQLDATERRRGSSRRGRPARSCTTPSGTGTTRRSSTNSSPRANSERRQHHDDQQEGPGAGTRRCAQAQEVRRPVGCRGRKHRPV